jgi:hypothetical protein
LYSNESKNYSVKIIYPSVESIRKGTDAGPVLEK